MDEKLASLFKDVEESAASGMWEPMVCLVYLEGLVLGHLEGMGLEQSVAAYGNACNAIHDLIVLEEMAS